VTQQRWTILSYRTAVHAAMALCIVSALAGRADAITLYATSIAGSQIDAVDTVTQSVSTYASTPSAADSIMFDNSQRLIYTAIFSGDVRRYDPAGPSDTLIAAGLNDPADMVLEPGGNTMLVSEYGGGKIDRIDLTTNTVTTLLSPGANPEGLAYDGARLFANLGARYGGPTGKNVAEIDPTTGNILAMSPGLDSLDGLTFDPFSGRLFASSLFANVILSINPNNLNDVQVVSDAFGRPLTIPAPDGITTDGVGNIYVASSASLGDSHIYQIDLINQSLTQNAFVYGLDDLAPASGDGSVPEPSTWALAVLGALTLLARRLRRK
jgi:sugar lactone lactonase YvrE